MSSGRVDPMASRRITPDQLSAAVNQILEKYGDDVKDNVSDIVKDITKQGVKMLKSEARSAVGGTGKYASGWTSQVETGRVSAQGTIYNGSVPGLPHLLEHGHANRGGGRTAGRVHIAPVEEQLIKEFESKVKSKL